MNIRRIGVVTACCAAALLAGSSALAGASGYPGSMCVQVFTPVSILYEGVIARNQASTSESFICNAVQTGGAISAWRVSVRDITPVGQITCNARASGEFDSAGFISPTVASGVAFMGTKTMGLGAPGTASFIAHGSKNVVCTMPPNGGFDGSAVSSYAITEL